MSNRASREKQLQTAALPPALERWYAKVKREKETAGFRLMSKEEAAKVPWRSGYLKHFAISKVLEENGITLYPFATDDNSGLLAVYLNGPLEGCVAFADHEDAELRAVIRNVATVRAQFEKGNRFTEYWADFRALRQAERRKPAGGAYEEDKDTFQKLVGFAAVQKKLTAPLKQWLAAELQSLTYPGDEDATQRVLKKLKLEEYDWFDDVPSLINGGRPERARALLQKKGVRGSAAAEALDAAVRTGHEGLVRWLLDAGLVPTEELLDSAIRSESKAQGLLIEAAAKRRPKLLIRCLPVAGWLDNTEAIDSLLEAKVPIDSVDAEGFTALAHAFRWCREKAFQLLQKKGAKSYGTAFAFDQFWSSENLAFAVKHRAQLDWPHFSKVTDSQGLTLLTFAVASDDLAAVKGFIAAGADPSKDPQALAYAVVRCHLEMAELLDRRGAPLALSKSLQASLAARLKSEKFPARVTAGLAVLCKKHGVKFPKG